MIKDPGEMTALIRIQAPVTTGSGIHKAMVWVDLGNTSESDPPRWTWAKWENVHGAEAWTASSVQAVAPATVSVWYDSRITRMCRIVDDAGTVYRITSLDDVRREHRQIELKVQASMNGS
jgi:head-tail adaptor